MFDAGPDARVAAAAADIAAHGGVDVLVRGPGRVAEQGRGGHDLSSLTVAALGHVERHPCGLQFLADGSGGHALDGGDGRRADAGDRRLAGSYGLAIHMHGAGPAKPGSAAELAAFQVKLVAQDPQERHIRVHIDCALGAIDFDGKGHLVSLPMLDGNWPILCLDARASDAGGRALRPISCKAVFFWGGPVHGRWLIVGP